MHVLLYMYISIYVYIYIHTYIHMCNYVYIYIYILFFLEGRLDRFEAAPCAAERFSRGHPTLDLHY